jgi:LmbE family N-acetylglucosaminyl deacetylase
MAYTLVSFHAHPDDEAMLTGGTLARAAAAGNRVVLVVATAGEAGLTGAGSDALGVRRTKELQRSAELLGCQRLVLLGYSDSGMAAEHRGFAAAPLDEAATRLADVLRAEAADVLTIYDRVGGYGHPDHRQVHRVGSRAAELAGTPVVLEATVDRRVLIRVLRLAWWTRLVPAGFSPTPVRSMFSDPAEITHRVDVRRYIDTKRSAMAAHQSQTTGGSTERTVAFCLRLPRWLFRRAFGTEWFIEQGRSPAARPSDDIFDGLRAGSA